MKRKSGHADIIDVAHAAGVSPATVSRAFNHPELLRPDTRKRIEDVVAELGYIRNRAASAIHGAKSGAVGLIVPTIDNAIFAKLIQSFSTVLEEAGQTLLIATHGYDLAKEYRQLRKLLEHRIDGLALIGLDHTEQTFDLIAARQAPTILMWNYQPEARLPCVGADNFQAGWLAANHIADLGHQRIATIFPPLVGNDRAGQRFAGVQAALTARGLSLPAAFQRTARYDLGEASQAAREMLAGEGRPTALIAGNDIIARGAVNAAATLSVLVPSQLSVIGIGDFTGSAELTPSLTTVRIDARRIANLAAQMLMTKLQDAGAATEAATEAVTESVNVPPGLVIRETTAALF